jgi:hypothetical protein
VWRFAQCVCIAALASPLAGAPPLLAPNSLVPSSFANRVCAARSVAVSSLTVLCYASVAVFSTVQATWRTITTATRPLRTWSTRSEKLRSPVAVIALSIFALCSVPLFSTEVIAVRFRVVRVILPLQPASVFMCFEAVSTGTVNCGCHHPLTRRVLALRLFSSSGR